MNCTRCPASTLALVALSALAGGSLVALTSAPTPASAQPGNTTKSSQPGNRPGRDQPGQPGRDPNHPLTNMPSPAAPGVNAPAPTQQEMMEAMKAAATPGPNHKFFDTWVGKWDTTTKIYPVPGGPAQESHGHSEFAWRLDGHWLAEHVDGQMMGMPMQGLGLSGYDNFNKRFVTCWVDNLSTSMITTTGSLDQSGKVLTLFGKMDEPTTGEHGKTVRFQTTIVDEDTHRLTIDEMQYGEPFTVVEVEYRRAK